MNVRHLVVLVIPLALFGCASKLEVVPLRAEAPSAPVLTLVWVGIGEAERFDRGAWARAPEFDYDFSVEQRRFGDRWESVKSLRRRHPGYDGSAGPRAQTYFFGIELGAPSEGGKVPIRIASTLGDGTGEADVEFRKSVLELHPDVSSFAPFDRYRITQSYDYEAGTLSETVELRKGDTPWVRNRETARLFAERRFDGPPTRR